MPKPGRLMGVKVFQLHTSKKPGNAGLSYHVNFFIKSKIKRTNRTTPTIRKEYIFKFGVRNIKNVIGIKIINDTKNIVLI